MARSHSPHPGQHRRSGDSSASSGCRSQRGAHHLRRVRGPLSRWSVRFGVWWKVDTSGLASLRRMRFVQCARSSTTTAWMLVPSRAFEWLRVDREQSTPSSSSSATDLVPEEDLSTGGLLDAWPPYDSLLDPINKVFVPRADIATDTLAAGLTELGWEVEDITAFRTVRAAAACSCARGHQDRWLRRGDVHLEQHGTEPGRDRRQAASVDRCCVHRSTHREDSRGARPACGRSR